MKKTTRKQMAEIMREILTSILARVKDLLSLVEDEDLVMRSYPLIIAVAQEFELQRFAAENNGALPSLETFSDQISQPCIEFSDNRMAYPLLLSAILIGMMMVEHKADVLKAVEKIEELPEEDVDE